MLKQIAENIYRKTVPLPHNPLRELNAYIIKGEKSLLIDTGFNRPECEEALQSAFDELGIDAVDLFITHLHSDHCGLVSKFAKEQSRVFASETDGELINFGSGNLYWSMLDELFIKFGFPRANFGRNTDIHPGRQYCNGEMVKFTTVAEGDVLEYGGYRLEAVAAPGHTPGHMCLYDREKKILLGGDLILGTISPNICIELCAENPLRDYLESLAKVGQMDVRLLLAAHGTEITDMNARIRELCAHHEARLAEVQKILGSGWKTAYMVAPEMNWDISCRTWEDFPAPQKWFATGEAISHLQYLYFAGKAQREEREGGYWFRNA